MSRRMLIIYAHRRGRAYFLFPREDVPATTELNCSDLGLKLASRKVVPDVLHTTKFTSVEQAKRRAQQRGFRAETIQWVTAQMKGKGVYDVR